MTTSDELADAMNRVARLLGLVSIEAGSVEFYIRSIAVTLSADEDTRRQIISGNGSASDWAGDIKKAAKQMASNGRMENDVHDRLRRAIAEAKSALNERGDLIHSAWRTASIFDEDPEPMRVAMRGLREEHGTQERIARVHRRLKDVHAVLKELFHEEIFWIDPWGAADYT